jgi:hypothetical protein
VFLEVYLPAKPRAPDLPAGSAELVPKVVPRVVSAPPDAPQPAADVVPRLAATLWREE